MTDTNQNSSKRVSSDFLLLHTPSGKGIATACTALLCSVLVLRFRAISHLGELLLGGAERDAGLYLWLIRTNVANLFELPWFETLSFFPYGKSLAWSDNFILPSLVVGLLNGAGLPFALSWNLLILSATFAAGFFCYLLAFRLTGKLIPALIAGMSFMSYGYFTGNLGHPQLQFAMWIPISTLLLCEYMRCRCWPYAVALGLSIALTFLTTVHFALFNVLLLSSLLIVIQLLRPGWSDRNFWTRLIGWATIGAAPAIPFILPYIEVKSVFGARKLYEAYYFSANALSYLSSSPFSALYNFTHTWTHSEAYLFPGVTIFALTLYALKRLFEAKPIRRFGSGVAVLLMFTAICSLRLFPYSQYIAALSAWLTLGSAGYFLYRFGALERKLGFDVLTNRAIIASFAFCALFAFIISLGPLANPAKGQYALSPHALLHLVFPGIDSLRAVSRIGVLVLFCGSMLAALAWDQITRTSLSKLAWLAPLPLMLIILESLPRTYPLAPEVPAPFVVQKLKEEIPYRAIMALPWTSELRNDGTVKSWGEYAQFNVRYMNWMVDSERPLVNGYSGIRSKILREYPRKMSGFPDRRSLNALSYIANLKYVLYASQHDPKFSRDTFERRIAQYPNELKLIMGDDAGNFLFEYTGAARLRDTYHVLAPSHADQEGFLHVELMSHYRDSAPEIEIEVTVDIAGTVNPVGVIALAANGEWSTFSMALKPVGETVRPLKFMFTPKWKVSDSEGSPVVYLRNPVAERTGKQDT